MHYTGDVEDIVSGAWEGHDVEPVALLPGRGESARGGFIELAEEGACQLKVDVALPVLHGQGGEDGTVQGALEACGVPYVGCGVLASAVCMDKDAAHRLAAAAGVRSPLCEVLYRGASDEECHAAVERCGGFPVFVKPARGGSSIGVSKASDEASYRTALEAAFALDEKVAIEEAIQASRWVARSWATRYAERRWAPSTKSSSRAMASSASISRRILVRIPSCAALRTFPTTCWRACAPQAARCMRRSAAPVSRASTFSYARGEVVFNEVNSTPGMTYYSRFPQMMRVAGHELDEVLAELIDAELEGVA